MNQKSKNSRPVKTGLSVQELKQMTAMRMAQRHVDPGSENNGHVESTSKNSQFPQKNGTPPPVNHPPTTKLASINKNQPSNNSSNVAHGLTVQELKELTRMRLARETGSLPHFNGNGSNNHNSVFDHRQSHLADLDRVENSRYSYSGASSPVSTPDSDSTDEPIYFTQQRSHKNGQYVHRSPSLNAVGRPHETTPDRRSTGSSPMLKSSPPQSVYQSHMLDEDERPGHRRGLSLQGMSMSPGLMGATSSPVLTASNTSLPPALVDAHRTDFLSEPPSISLTENPPPRHNGSYPFGQSASPQMLQPPVNGNVSSSNMSNGNGNGNSSWQAENVFGVAGSLRKLALGNNTIKHSIGSPLPPTLAPTDPATSSTSFITSDGNGLTALAVFPEWDSRMGSLGTLGSPPRPGILASLNSPPSSPSNKGVLSRKHLSISCPAPVRQRSLSDSNNLPFEVAESVLLTPTGSQSPSLTWRPKSTKNERRDSLKSNSSERRDSLMSNTSSQLAYEIDMLTDSLLDEPSGNSDLAPFTTMNLSNSRLVNINK